MAALSEDAAAAAKRAALHDISNKGAMSGVSEKVTAALRSDRQTHVKIRSRARAPGR